MHHYETVGDDGWNRKDTLHYQIPTISTGGNYCLELGLRYNSQYPYEGLWIVAETRLNNPHAVFNDTIYINTADKDGHQTGRGLVLI